MYTRSQLTTHEIRHRGCIAFVGYMRHIRFGQIIKQLDRQMRACAIARARDIDSLGFGGEFEQLFCRFNR